MSHWQALVRAADRAQPVGGPCLREPAVYWRRPPIAPAIAPVLRAFREEAGGMNACQGLSKAGGQEVTF